MELEGALPRPLDVEDDARRTEDELDIYRGSPPPPRRSSSPTPSSLTAASSSSSSSSISFRGRGRLGAIAAVVEHAISRWARRNGSISSRSSDTSGSSSSSSSDTSSLNTRSRSHRRRRRNSIGTAQSLRSEQNFLAAITRIKAREESRQIPRKFSLYLPHSVPQDGSSGSAQRIVTTSLECITKALGTALTKSAKYRKNHERNKLHKGHIGVSPNDQLRMTGDVQCRSVRFESIPAIGHKKGKSKVVYTEGTGIKPAKTQPRAWFLDVASPTWEDMKALGRLLHIHPLTLEDILQREPREKLDLFPKLGYYFISFRAIESQEALRNRELSGYQVEGAAGEANIYIVVFEEGVCTFHFTDMSEHTDRIQNRIQKLEETQTTSSDWIAHGILDSVVDSFFPFLQDIEQEVMAIEDLVFSTGPGDGPSILPHPPTVVHAIPKPTPASDYAAQWHRSEKVEMPTWSTENEKNFRAQVPSTIKFRTPSISFPPLRILFNRTRRLVATVLRSVDQPLPFSPSPTTLTLRRMAKIRRLVVSLARLLGAKLEVVAQIRKRLLAGDQPGMAARRREDYAEIAIHMGDIEDHILTLQHALSHYERMLSQSHPTYLSQLRTTSATARSGTDHALLYLTSVSIAVLCVQTIIGSFSLNIHIPSNGHDNDSPFNVFGIVIALALAVLCIYATTVRRWWFQAKELRRRPM